MIRHIVLFRRKRDIVKDAALEQSLTRRMDTLGTQIPGIRGWVFRANETDRLICWDYVTESNFENDEALQAYLTHPAHQTLVAEVKLYFEWAVVDYTSHSE